MFRLVEVGDFGEFACTQSKIWQMRQIHAFSKIRLISSLFRPSFRRLAVFFFENFEAVRSESARYHRGGFGGGLEEVRERVGSLVCICFRLRNV